MTARKKTYKEEIGGSDENPLTSESESAEFDWNDYVIAADEPSEEPKISEEAPVSIDKPVLNPPPIRKPTPKRLPQRNTPKLPMLK